MRSCVDGACYSTGQFDAQCACRWKDCFWCGYLVPRDADQCWNCNGKQGHDYEREDR